MTLLSAAESYAAPKVTIPYSQDFAAWWQTIVDWYHWFITGGSDCHAAPKVTTYELPSGIDIPA